MAPHSRLRAVYVGCALATMGIGLAVHLGGARLPPAVRDVLGDALWAMMLTWSISALWPRLALGRRAVLALVISWAVELSQLYHTPWLDEVRATTLGHLVLGSGFDPRDLAAYALGVFGAVLIEHAVASRLRTSS